MRWLPDTPVTIHLGIFLSPNRLFLFNNCLEGILGIWFMCISLLQRKIVEN